jgi:hypothetical protein
MVWLLSFMIITLSQKDQFGDGASDWQRHHLATAEASRDYLLFAFWLAWIIGNDAKKL